VAWSFYIENQDAPAYELAQLAAQGVGPWVGEAWWTAGLAAWRLGDCDGAALAFQNAAARSENAELTSAAYYWQGRALVRCRKPEQAATILRKAAARDETFYGMLATEQLGMRLPQQHAGADFTQADWQTLRNDGNVRVAVALAEIGEDGLADQVLRHQARIGSPSEYGPLSRLARDLGLPSTQLWMAYNAPNGGRPTPASRFPTPKWQPVGGWQVDPALVYAHVLQESVFQTGVVSPMGARGLMQIMPAAAQDHANALGYSGSASDLNKPEVNLAFGQRHLLALRDAAGTQGLLPKVMAAYNAGPLPISRWQTEIRDQGDPLLWMESVPYWETRGYVNIVMRNYWMYERQAGGISESREALAQGMWPTFPGLASAKGVRMSASGAILRGR
jgi:soluble lytic murein transglycosylase-like protein